MEEYNFYAGDGIDMALRRALAAAGDSDGIHMEEGIPMCREWFNEDPLYHVRPYPHMPVSYTHLITEMTVLCVPDSHSGE